MIIKPMSRRSLGLLACVLLGASGLSSCSSYAASQPPWKLAVMGDGPGDPGRIVNRRLTIVNLPKSTRGNPSEYTVFGKEYTVLDSADGFREQGIASWYGKKFHGRLTSSGEVYDMHQMTAAHKHLPLPTFVRVTRVDNGKSVVVKVNDRGPFVEDRVIDLSYAAAASLDMLEAGKAEVIVEALSTHEGEPQAPGEVTPVQEAAPAQAPPVQQQAPAPQAAGAPASQYESQFLQVGAYSDELNAKTMQANLQDLVSVDTQISLDAERRLFRVLIGPMDDPQTFTQVRDSLMSAGIDSHRVTTTNR